MDPSVLVEFEAWARSELHPRRCGMMVAAVQDFFGGLSFSGSGASLGSRATEATQGDISRTVAGHGDNFGPSAQRYGEIKVPELALRHFTVFCSERRASRRTRTLTREELAVRGGKVSARVKTPLSPPGRETQADVISPSPFRSPPASAELASLPLGT